jgi:hypothetical protein
MRRFISYWLVLGLLIGWTLYPATVLGQTSVSKSATPGETLRANLDKSVTIDYNGESLKDVISHFREKTGLSILIDPVATQLDPNVNVVPPNGAPMQVGIPLKAANEKASQVLRKLLNQFSLTYIIIDDGILVTTNEMAAARQLLVRVSVDIDEVPLKKAVRDLAKRHAVNVVLDPKVSKQAETSVSLQLENTSVETTFRMLAEMASLKAIRMGNVMFVTSEEKAKAIRDEESHQLDTPLYSNFPGSEGAPLIRGAMPAGGIQIQPPGVFVPGGGAPPLPFGPVVPMGPPNGGVLPTPQSEPIPAPMIQRPVPETPPLPRP